MSRGFLPGLGVGALVATLALTLLAALSDGDAHRDLAHWLALNLGSSSGLFALVLVLFVVHLARLRRLLDGTPERRLVVELDQLTDVWTHVFIGIGVVWTAVGMRSALQATLSDADQVVAGSAGTMLKRLVDGGILVALTTTIVGAVGGYLMRLAKTLYVGAALHAFYDALQQRDVRELVDTVRRIERSLEVRRPAEEERRASG